MLEKLNQAHGGFCHYEPEIFPGLIYRILTLKVVVLIFVSGKIVLTGARTWEDIYNAYKEIYPVLKQYAKKDSKKSMELKNYSMISTPASVIKPVYHK